MSESLQVQLKKGVLEMCVLALLSKGDNYAYEIASQMAEAVGMGEGTIYPLMRRMQNDDLGHDLSAGIGQRTAAQILQTDQGGRRRSYGAARRMGRVRNRRRQDFGRRVMNRAMFLSELRMGLFGPAAEGHRRDHRRL